MNHFNGRNLKVSMYQATIFDWCYSHLNFDASIIKNVLKDFFNMRKGQDDK